ncbi:MAG: hypothetical protein PV344_07050, partial [Anaplasma sp.]|nr:hypothetical protein [Anaplasma sp.]
TQRHSSHDTTLLVPKPCKGALRGLVSSVPGTQPKGRGFEPRLKFFTFSLRQINYFIKCNNLRHAATSNSHYTPSFNPFHSTRDVTFHVSAVGSLKFPREVMWL